MFDFIHFNDNTENVNARDLVKAINYIKSEIDLNRQFADLRKYTFFVVSVKEEAHPTSDRMTVITILINAFHHGTTTDTRVYDSESRVISGRVISTPGHNEFHEVTISRAKNFTCANITRRITRAGYYNGTMSDEWMDATAKEYHETEF